MSFLQENAESAKKKQAFVNKSWCSEQKVSTLQSLEPIPELIRRTSATRPGFVS